MSKPTKLLAQISGKSYETVSGEAFFYNSVTTGNSQQQAITEDSNWLVQGNPVLQLDETDFVTTWYVPSGVTSICAVAIGSGGNGEGSNITEGGSGAGGAGLAYINDYPVYEGQEFTIHVGRAGSQEADGQVGAAGFPSALLTNGKLILKAHGGGGGRVITDGGKGGGFDGIEGVIGYSGSDGNDGGTNTGGNGGSAGGWYADGVTNTDNPTTGDSGKGTSPYGEGVLGSEYSGENSNFTVINGGVGSDFGAGGGGASDEANNGTDYDGGRGGRGCVRIIWGEGRSFPSTRCGETDSVSVFKYIVNED